LGGGWGGRAGGREYKPKREMEKKASWAGVGRVRLLEESGGRQARKDKKKRGGTGE
jgi:hypothetical protein